MAEPYLTLEAEGPRLATLILAHGAGAPMDSDSMNQLAASLARHGVATVRFEFPYMKERRDSGGKKPPNRQPVLLDCWRRVFADVRRRREGALLIGGKSMGGRMAALVADELQPTGFCCFGFPFHPPGKPERSRLETLQQCRTPGLVLQGTRDPFGRRGEIEGADLAQGVHLHWLEAGDHDFKPTVKSGRTQAELMDEAADAVARFCRALSGDGAL